MDKKNTNAELSQNVQNNENISIQDRLKAIMRDNNWTQAELAKIAGVTPSSVTAWFKGDLGKRGISAECLLKVALEAKCDLYWLISGLNFGQEMNDNNNRAHTSKYLEIRPLSNPNIWSERFFLSTLPCSQKRYKKEIKSPFKKDWFVPNYFLDIYVSTEYLENKNINHSDIRQWYCEDDSFAPLVKENDLIILNTVYRDKNYYSYECKDIQFQKGKIYLFEFNQEFLYLRYAQKTIDNKKLYLWTPETADYKEQIYLEHNYEEEPEIYCYGEVIGRCGFIK